MRRSLPLVELLIVACLLLVAWLLLRDRLPSLLPAARDRDAAASEADVAEATAQLDSMPAARPGQIVAGGYLEVIPPGAMHVSSDVDARILAIHAVPGERVHAEQVLASLDSSPFRLELDSLASDRAVASRELELAQAGSRSEEIEVAAAAVNSAQAELKLAQEEAQRAIELFDKGVISQAEMRTFQTAEETSRQTLGAAQSTLSQLQAGTRSEEIGVAEARIGQLDSRIAEIRWKIAHCEVQSPMDGVVLEQLADVGEWTGVAKDDPAAAALMSIYDPSQLQAWADINQRDSGLLQIGQAVSLTTDSHPERAVPGRLSAIMPLASIQKNTVQIKIEIDNPPLDFLPGLGVRVSIDTANTGGSLDDGTEDTASRTDEGESNDGE
jgi:multidrug resistance efflux pump